MTERTIDVHAHVGKTVANNIGQTVDELLRRMDAAGVSEAILSPAAADRQAEGIANTRRMNDVVADAVRRHPDRFPAGFGLVEPRHEELAIEELTRVLDELGLVGIAVHPMLEGYYLDHPLRVRPLFEILDQHGALCLMHCSPDAGSGESPSAVRAVVSQYPRVTTFLGHAFLAPQQKADAIEIVREYPHVYFDVAYQSDPAMTASLVEAVGSDRVVFGSDQPFYELAAVRQSVMDADISESERQDVLYRNVQRILSSR